MNNYKQSSLTVAVSSACLVIAANFAVAKTVETPLSDANFLTPTIIDNPYWPLPIGGTFTYFAETEDGCEYNKLSVSADTHVVTDDSIDYTTLIVRDQEWVHEPEDGEECDAALATLDEDTHDYYAQDDAGNIWYFGEDTFSWDDEEEECTDDGAWEAGVDGAEPGIVMLAMPQSGLRYKQEYWEDEAEDWGAVLRLNAKVSIEYLDGEFEGCLMTREWTPIEPGEIEHKFYCPEDGNPGPGLMFIEELKGKTVYVEYTGTGIIGAPGEDSAEFPAEELGCAD